jgi:hypothetical protein
MNTQFLSLIVVVNHEFIFLIGGNSGRQNASTLIPFNGNENTSDRDQIFASIVLYPSAHGGGSDSFCPIPEIHTATAVPKAGSKESNGFFGMGKVPDELGVPIEIKEP